MYIILTIKIRKEGEVWTAVCLELGTATDADSFEEVGEAIEELILLHLEGLKEAGELEHFIEKHGIKVYHRKPHPQKISIPYYAEESTYIKPLLQKVSA
jgi:predicted RNase H-like HicB family nuclease